MFKLECENCGEINRLNDRLRNKTILCTICKYPIQMEKTNDNEDVRIAKNDVRIAQNKMRLANHEERISDLEEVKRHPYSHCHYNGVPRPIPVYNYYEPQEPPFYMSNMINIFTSGCTFIVLFIIFMLTIGLLDKINIWIT